MFRAKLVIFRGFFLQSIQYLYKSETIAYTLILAREQQTENDTPPGKGTGGPKQHRKEEAWPPGQRL
jgi:hypothetical protein